MSSEEMATCMGDLHQRKSTIDLCISELGTELDRGLLYLIDPYHYPFTKESLLAKSHILIATGVYVKAKHVLSDMKAISDSNIEHLHEILNVAKDKILQRDWYSGTGQLLGICCWFIGRDEIWDTIEELSLWYAGVDDAWESLLVQCDAILGIGLTYDTNGRDDKYRKALVGWLGMIRRCELKKLNTICK